MYGPIPVIRENIPISAGTEKTQQYREPVDSVVSYIVQLLDEAAEVLPLKIGAVTLDMGKPTKPAALALKARRSEEHTSELQSLMRISYAVFCLKKKKAHNNETKRR